MEATSYKEREDCRCRGGVHRPGGAVWIEVSCHRGNHHGAQHRKYQAGDLEDGGEARGGLPLRPVVFGRLFSTAWLYAAGVCPVFNVVCPAVPLCRLGGGHRHGFGLGNALSCGGIHGPVGPEERNPAVPDRHAGGDCSQSAPAQAGGGF